jgi:hypothetical protein
MEGKLPCPSAPMKFESPEAAIALIRIIHFALRVDTWEYECLDLREVLTV